MNCRKHESEVGPISWAGNCMNCAEFRLRENIIGLAEHKGEPMQRWRRGMILCAGGLTPDDLEQAV
jgi:hypothetical protein